MGAFDPGRKNPKILYLVIVDAVAVSLLSWFTVTDVIALYPTAAIASAVLLVINVLILRLASDSQPRYPRKGIEMPKMLWFGVGAFTAGAVVEIAFWVRQPDTRSAIEAIVGIVLAGYVWFLVYRVRRFNKDRHGRWGR